MKRRLFSILAALSLLLCIANIAFWFRSHRVPAGATPTNTIVLTALARRMPEVQVQNVALDDCIDFFSDVTGLPIQVDWPALESANVGRNTLVSLSVKGHSMGDTLATVLRQANSQLVFVVRDEAVRISVRGAPPSTQPILVPGDHNDVIAAYFAQYPAKRPPPPPPPIGEIVLGERRFTLLTQPGWARLWSTPADPAAVYQLQTPVGSATSLEGPFVVYRLGASLRTSGSPLDSWVVTVPLWLSTTTTAILPILWLLLRVRRIVRPAPGFCPSCGYDLRATPARCPECGHVPADTIVPTIRADS